MTSVARAEAGLSSSRLRRIAASSWFPPMLAGIIAIAAGAALPLAPVEQSRVDISWPVVDGATESTTLLLTNQTPHTLEVAFSGEAARAAASAGGTVLATIRPGAPNADTTGLVVTADEAAVTIATGGEDWSWPIVATDRWEVHSSIHGTAITRNGHVVADSDTLPPQVDALITDAEGIPAADLSVRSQIVDDSNSRPTIGKVALLVVLLVALVMVMVMLHRDDRVRGHGVGSNRSPGRTPFTQRARRRLTRALRSLSPADAVIVILLTAWVFIGPMTDDDGYYAAMAYNATEAGYVGNYFQMFNQTFTPFTWLWQFFDVWQHVGGRSPVWLRVPSLVFAIVGWFVSRSILNRLLVGRGWVFTEASRLLLALVTFVWWASYSIGARPESFAAMAAIVVIALLWRAHRTRRLVPAAIAVGIAGLSFAAHPIGIVAAAPVILAIPTLWVIARDGSPLSAAVARTIAVASTSTVALFAAFNDGTLSDMLTGQKRFALVETPLSWVDEFRRYSLLWADIPMGSFARRSVVLVGLVLLVWFVVFAIWSRRASPFAKPAPLSLVGWSFALSFILMWITTSKWTHHFGALASVGPLFIVAMCVGIPRLIAQVRGSDSRLPAWLAPVALASVVPAMILSMRGPDWWAYEWGEGDGIGNRGRPAVLGISLGEDVVWAALAVVILAVSLILVRRRLGSSKAPAALYGLTALVAVFFGAVGTDLLGTFARLATVHDGFTVSKANLQDPTGSRCLPDKAIGIWDAASGTPLTTARGTTSTQGFEPISATDVELPATARVAAWTTRGSAQGVGSLASEWYSVPDLTDDQHVGVLVSGDFSTRTRGVLNAEVRSGGKTETIPLVDSAPRSGWTTLLIPTPAGGSTVELRILAEDISAADGADVSVSAPAIADKTTLHDVATPGAPTAVGWTQAFWFPCDRPMTIARGVIEPPVFATTYGPNGIDNIWIGSRGGSLAGVQRLALVNTPATGVGQTLNNTWGRVHLFEFPTASHAYDLTQTWVTAPGWRSAFDPASQLIVD